MIIFDADDPLVLTGVYDREGYKPGERERIRKARERTRQLEQEERMPDMTTEAPVSDIEQIADDLHDLDAAVDVIPDDLTPTADEDAAIEREAEEQHAADTAPTDALVGELGQQATQYDAAAAAERRAENPEMQVFDGPFDAQQALEQIFELEDEVEAANREYLSRAQRAKQAKDALNERREALDKVIKEYRDRARNVEAMQPRLRTVEDIQHEVIERRRERVAKALEGRGVIAQPDDLTPFTREDLDTLELWIQNPGPIAPELIGRCHRAGVIGENGHQHCTRCEALLEFLVDGDTGYAEGVLVGFDCPGQPPEETRTTKRRGTRKASAKHDPETEREAQRNEGKKKATKKAKS